MGGKEVLIKSIAQAIPVYAMMVFKIPKKICKGITDTISQFWWGDDNDGKRMHWQEWWELCKPKGKGGMGFRDMHSFNLAMLAKQVWRLLLEPNSLCARVLRAKYYGNVLAAKTRRNMSYTWRSILKGLEVLKRGIIWRIGDGSRIRIWQDPWIPREWSRCPITPRMNNILTHVEELIDPSTGQWDEQLV